MISLVSILILFTLQLKAPLDNRVVIIKDEPVRPYEAVWNATCKVESNFNPFAVGDTTLQSWSYGIVQIRKIRLDDYFMRTGIRYTTKDMFDPAKAKEVFIYFADRIGPYDIERISRNWNGAWRLTASYWKRVSKHL